MRKVVFDIETKNTFDEVESNNPADLDISVVCIYDYETDKYYSYTEDQLQDLWPILEKTDIIVGYNSDHFDLPLLNKYYPGDLGQIKSLDLMQEIRKSLGRRLKLDDVASATLGIGKSSDGLQAVLWWKQGKIQDIIDYCIQDVKVTKDVHDYAMERGMLLYPSAGQKGIIHIDTSDWNYTETDGSGMTMTMGF